MYKGNIGEWSELYALLKILGDGYLLGADENLNALHEYKYIVEKVFRESNNKDSLVYSIDHAAGIVKISVNNSENLPPALQETILKGAGDLLCKLQTTEKSSKIENHELKDFLQALSFPKMKADSNSKRDITLIVKDFKHQLQQEVGFSIKSKLGGSSTLFNAGKATNFQYKVHNIAQLDQSKLEELLKSKAATLVKGLYRNGCTLEYTKTLNDKFLQNLLIIDSKLDCIMASLTLGHYLGLGNVRKLGDFLEQENPCAYTHENAKDFYKYKIKQFLSASALGMTPTSEWYGNIDATGGYIVVKENGELVCYHIYNWNALENYLYNSTKLETASTSRHNFGRLYKENDDYFIDLNLQVRFI